MPQQRSRTRAVIPGKAILGVAGAAAADRKTLGGAVVPGRGVLGNLAEQENARALEAKRQRETRDPKAATGPRPPKAAKKDDGTPPLVAPAREAKVNAPPAPVASLSEAEVTALLDADPEAWEHVLDLEAARPDGMRPAIAAIILAHQEQIVENPIPHAAVEALQQVALAAAEAAG